YKHCQTFSHKEITPLKRKLEQGTRRDDARKGTPQGHCPKRCLSIGDQRAAAMKCCCACAANSSFRSAVRMRSPSCRSSTTASLTSERLRPLLVVKSSR